MRSMRSMRSHRALMQGCICHSHGHGLFMFRRHIVGGASPEVLDRIYDRRAGMQTDQKMLS